MPSRPRKDVVRPGAVGVYQCWSRCVRRAFLCGLDPRTGKVCGIYIDLNQIRAGEATTPKSSTHTSAYDRIVARDMRLSEGESNHDRQQAVDGWLCELTIDEMKDPRDSSSIRSATARRASDKGLIPMSLDDYLDLLDASGRLVRDDKAGAIPGEIAPILERLGVQADLWPELVSNYHDWFGHIVGSTKKLAQRALETGRNWYRSQSHCAAAFG